MKNTRKSLNILFIGNSHTYYNKDALPYFEMELRKE